MNPKEIKQARLSRGMRQAEIAEATGIPQPTISAFERGRIDLTDEQKKQILCAIKAGHYIPTKLLEEYLRIRSVQISMERLRSAEKASQTT